MAESDDSETSPKTISRELESLCRKTIKRRYKSVEDGLLAAVDKWMKKSTDAMVNVLAGIQAFADEHHAERLCRELLDAEQLTGRLAQALVNHLYRHYNPAVSSPVPDREVIVIDSDTDENGDGNEDEGEGDAGNNGRGEMVNQDATGLSRSMTSNCTGAKRRMDNQPDEPPSQPSSRPK
jgi:hypothetical protein